MGLRSDGPTQFRNKTPRLLAKSLRGHHHITKPNCSWSNGAIERLSKELLRIARAVLLELQLRQDAWPDLIPLFTSVLNNSSSQQRGGISSFTAFTGLNSSPLVSIFMCSVDATPIKVSEAITERSINVEQLVTRMADLRPVVEHMLESNHHRARKAQ